MFKQSHRNHTNRIFYQKIFKLVNCCLLPMGACQELFCISEDFCASGMQVAEVTKSLMTLSYFHRQQKKIEPRELSDCLFPVTPWFEFHSKKPPCLLSEWLMFCRKNSFVNMQAKLLWNYHT